MRVRRDLRAGAWFFRYRGLALVADLALTVYPTAVLLYGLLGILGIPLAILLSPIAFLLGGACRLLFCERGAFRAYDRNFLPDAAPTFRCELRIFAYPLALGAGALTALPIGVLTGADGDTAWFCAAVLGAVGLLGGEHMGRTVSGCLRMEHLLTALFLFCVTSLLTPLVVESVAIAVLFLIASLVIGIVCYGTLLVQVGILRLATTSSTCHLTRPMLKSGTRQILRLLLAIFLLALVLILIASFLVVLLRMPIMLIIMAGKGVSDVQFFDVIFDVPTGIPTVNAILSALGALLLVPSVILLLRLRRPSTREAWLRRLFASSDRRGQGREGVAVEYRLAYTDTIRACADGAPTLPADYAELTRRLAECESDCERLRLAYRMMVACLVSRRMGVALSDTPREIAAALVSRGIGSDAEGMSRAFETAVYAPPGTDGEDASLQPLLERILQITRVYLP